MFHVQKLSSCASVEKQLFLCHFPISYNRDCLSISAHPFLNYRAVWSQILQNTIFYQYETVTIKNSPNFDKKFFTEFREKSMCIAHGICKFWEAPWNTRIPYIGISRSEMIEGLAISRSEMNGGAQQTYPGCSRLPISQDVRN
ncbi:hypothetical protein T07_269 [Trichinella nelsoni]|uniref:Uncharacterized protein n=1 Tax=Trichinella nelsoni TaxID=6336 RepID=A0A0V0S363_9BILA|nr:hypothetical protein T07_269 [Trichinella nelsoni]